MWCDFVVILLYSFYKYNLYTFQILYNTYFSYLYTNIIIQKNYVCTTIYIILNIYIFNLINFKRDKNRGILRNNIKKKVYFL